MKYFLSRLRRVKFNQIIQIWKLPVAFVVAPIYRLRHNKLWIVSEAPNEARDNGYWFFQFLREKHPEQECVYAIQKSSHDFSRVAEIGKTVEYGSLLHWIMYLASEVQISSQKAGNPNAAIFFFLEVYGFLKNRRLFLQHGVIINDLKWLYYDVTKMSGFVCGALPEYEYIRERFGYPASAVRYTGLCRFDGLHDFATDPELILIMPTWREWIADEDYRLLKYEGTTEIPKTGYFRHWIAFLQDSELAEIAATYHVRFIFFPHREMQKYMQYFPESTDYLEIADGHKYDVQDLLKRAALMITDYSSVNFDMLYMKKPVIYYQFDYEQFREGQYAEGYFHYQDNPFAHSFRNAPEVFAELREYIGRGYKVSEQYLKAHSEYFPLFDQNNCERVYQVAEQLSR